MDQFQSRLSGLCVAYCYFWALLFFLSLFLFWVCLGGSVEKYLIYWYKIN